LPGVDRELWGEAIEGFRHFAKNVRYWPVKTRLAKRLVACLRGLS
jgi:hypothetical protein